MGTAPETDINSVPAGSQTSGSHGIGSLQDSVYMNAQNDIRARQHRQNSERGQSRILNYQTSHASSADSESIGSSSWNRFEIPTRNNSLSSGFPFHHRLYDLKVNHDQWSLFNSDIVTAAKVTPSRDFMSWATGITAGTITAPVLLVLGPVMGYYTGRLVHRKAVVKTVKERLGQEGDLRSVLQRWNNETFEEKGFQAWLELPLDPGQLNKEYLLDETLENPKAQKKAAKKAARRFRIIITPITDSTSSGIPVTTTTTAESITSGVLPIPNIPPPTDDNLRTPQDQLYDTVADPPAYSPENENSQTTRRASQRRGQPLYDVKS